MNFYIFTIFSAWQISINSGSLHVERYERALCFQRPRGHDAEGYDALWRMGTPTSSQHVWLDASHVHIWRTITTLREPTSTIHLDASSFYWIPTLLCRLDGRQHGKLGAFEGLHSHVFVSLDFWNESLRSRYWRIFSKSRRRADVEVVSSRRLSTLYAQPRPHWDQEEGALVVWG